MKLILLANHAGVLPVMDHYHQQGWLQAVVSTDKLAAHNLQIEDYCKTKHLKYIKVNQAGLQTEVTQLFADLQPDVAIMFGFSYRIPPQLFRIPRMGFFNVHFSLLPAYRGPDPIFWQLKNGETTGGITIHRVDEQFDSGVIVMQQEIPFIPGESWGICNSRFGVIACNMLAELIKKIQQNILIEEIPANHNEANYESRPTLHDLTIDWDTQTASQIENLVNACNPHLGGAVTTFKHQTIRIMEVSPVDGQGNEATQGGTIVHADYSGLFVQCADAGLLRINILVLLNEGTISGFKLAALGIANGEKFGNYLLETQLTN